MSQVIFEQLFERMEADEFSESVWSFPDFKRTYSPTVKLVKKACKEKGVVFEEFLSYWRERKLLERRLDKAKSRACRRKYLAR